MEAGAARVPKVVLAERIVTKKGPADGSDRLMEEETFLKLAVEGRFLFSWESHGFFYGIEKEVLNHPPDRLVVINGSREYFPKALAIRPDLVPVSVTADISLLRERLEKRGRETAGEIEERLAAARNHNVLPGDAKILEIDNSGDPGAAGDKFVAFLSGLAEDAA